MATKKLMCKEKIEWNYQCGRVLKSTKKPASYINKLPSLLKQQGWFEEVVLIVWGPSAKLTSENKMIQDYIRKMQEAGVKVEACLYCAKMYGVDKKLAELGIDVKGMGIPLSNYLKEGWRILSL